MRRRGRRKCKAGVHNIVSPQLPKKTSMKEQANFEPTQQQGCICGVLGDTCVLSFLFFSFIELTEGTQPSLIWENRRLFSQRGGSWLRLFNNTQLLRPKGDRATALQRIFDLHNTEGLETKNRKKRKCLISFFLFLFPSPNLYCA